MKNQLFLEHHGLNQNPFSQEDAQSDQLFKQHCAHATYHPSWDKIYGSADDPSTSVVFGEKGSGKTALRLQIVESLEKHNRANPNRRVFVIEYDDFNPFLDCFQQRMPTWNRAPNRALAQWRLWDHMDALLTLGVTNLVNDILNDRIGGEPGPFEVSSAQLQQLSRSQQRDLLLLAACYDNSKAEAPRDRWAKVRRKLRFSNLACWRDLSIGIVVTAVLFRLLIRFENLSALGNSYWPGLVLLAGWGAWLWRTAWISWLSFRIKRQVRVIDHAFSPLRAVLAQVPDTELVGQPAPSVERSDDRYKLIDKFMSILETLGFRSVVVLVDRVDEPHLINGAAERMKEFLWPMFDNKFLKHAGIGFKLLLPIEVSFFLTREDKEFYERSRLDKQNLIRSLEWTGESLYDLANDRIRACQVGDKAPDGLKTWFESAVSEAEIVASFARLRVPRHLFKFLHRLLVEHCHRYTDESPRWEIGRETFQSTLAVYLKDLEAHDRGLGTG